MSSRQTRAFFSLIRLALRTHLLMQIYFIRHAQSANNSKPEAERVEDPGITELGHKQAKATAKWIAALKIDYLVTSAFRRTLESTSYIAEHLQQQPYIWRDLHEVGGCYRGHRAGEEEGRPGMTYDEISSEFPLFEIDPEIGIEGWWQCRPYESTDQAMLRANLIIKRFVEEFGETSHTVAAVIHADFKVCLLRLLLGNAFVNQHLGPMMNMGVTKFTYRNGQWRLDLLNSVTHLQPNQLS